MSAGADRSVLVVVPVYGDLESLLGCVDALVEHLDHDRHRVLLVNDCGPDADTIERALRDRITGVPGFRYERNDANLGFVGTCNRAVLELDTTDADVLLLNSDTVPRPGFVDAMLDVLYGDETTGVVTARSNNATIASIPYRLTNRGAARTEARTDAVWTALAPYLPTSQVMPVAMGFCFLTRRTLTREHGLFDEAFAPGYGEENDYCLRVAAHGWTARIANHALVQHAGSKSFTGNRNALRAAHQRELERRYPFLPDAVAAYQRHGMTAAERFADCLVPSGALPRVAIDASGVADPAPILQAAAAAFPATRFALEARIAPGASAAVPGVAASDTWNVDDLVSAVVLVDPTPAQVVEANRRGMVVAVVRTSSADTIWSDPTYRAGGPAVGTLLDPVAVAVGTPDDIGVVANAIESALALPLDERVAAVSARWRALLPLDVTAADVSAGQFGDEAARLRAELAELRASRSFRAGDAIAKVARRLPGRRG